MQTYNWMAIPTEINPKYIISAFENIINAEKVEKYTEQMLETYDTEYTFPPIMWYPVIIDEDIMEDERYFVNWEEIEEEDIWKLCWFVTDWHHRAISAYNAKKRYIDLELDRSSITRQEELDYFDNN